MSFQKGSIEKKRSGKYLLRYRVRDAKHPRGWRKAAELIEAATDKAAERERVRRSDQPNFLPTSLPPQGIGGMMNSSNAMKKGRLLAALIAGEEFEPPTFGL